MSTFEQYERIQRPPEQVFDLLTDHEAAPRWLPTVVGLEMITPGPLGSGSRLRETREVMGRRDQAELEVSGYDRPRSYTVTNTTKGVTATYRYSLTAAGGDATLIRLRCEVRAHGLRKISGVLLTAVLRRQDRDHLARLRRALEGD